MKTIIAILCIFVLEIIALEKHVDGIALSVSIGAIAGLGGYSVGEIIKKFQSGG